MPKINVDFYEKRYSHCSQCIAMRNVLNSWVDQHPESDVTIVTMAAEDNLDKLKEEVGDVLSAPVIRVKCGKSVEWVSGLNPDILVDMLDGRSSIWED